MFKLGNSAAALDALAQAAAIDKSQAIIEFNTDGDLSKEALSNISEDMRVQLESLEDGTYDDICGVTHTISNQDTTATEI